jgi:hypothetical protein
VAVEFEGHTSFVHGRYTGLVAVRVTVLTGGVADLDLVLKVKGYGIVKTTLVPFLPYLPP